MNWFPHFLFTPKPAPAAKLRARITGADLYAIDEHGGRERANDRLRAAYGPDVIEPRFTDRMSEGPWSTVRQPVLSPLDAEDFPGSTMTPAPTGCPSLGGSLGLDPPAPIVSLNPGGNFVVIRDRVSDVFDPRFVAPTFIVEQAPHGDRANVLLAWVLDGNGMRTDRFPHANDSLGRREGSPPAMLTSFDRKRIVARFHTFGEAAKALEAARDAWELSNHLPHGRASRALGEEVQTCRVALAEAHRQADEIRERMTLPFVDKLSATILARQAAMTTHVEKRDAAVKAAMGVRS